MFAVAHSTGTVPGISTTAEQKLRAIWWVCMERRLRGGRGVLCWCDR